LDDASRRGRRDAEGFWVMPPAEGAEMRRDFGDASRRGGRDAEGFWVMPPAEGAEMQRDFE